MRAAPNVLQNSTFTGIYYYDPGVSLPKFRKHYLY
eukprot:SAG11_NODE_21022_length_433_cov_1.577844_1_plen_34_part_10